MINYLNLIIFLFIIYFYYNNKKKYRWAVNVQINVPKIIYLIKKN